MYSKFKQHKLFFLILFILNFKSLNTFDRDDKHYVEIDSECIDCFNNKQQNSSILLAINSFNLTSNSSSLINLSSNDSNYDKNIEKQTQSIQINSNTPTIRSDLLDYTRSFDHSITFRSIPNLVLLDDLPKNSKQQTNSRKKQLDLDLESINLNSNTNYRLDEFRNDKIDLEKQKLKENIDNLQNNNTQMNLDKQNNSSSFQQQQLTTAKSIIHLDLKQDKPSMIKPNRQQLTEHRFRRINEQQINRRIKNTRQNYSIIQSNNYSILRKFYPINHINQLANVNKYTIEDAKLATLEIVKLQKDGKCKLPTKRIIPVYKLLNRNQFSKKILPHCTILFRCETETGCCNSDSEYCTMKSEEHLRIPFWTIQLSADGQQFKNIEWFTFSNHTECECRSK